MSGRKSRHGFESPVGAAVNWACWWVAAMLMFGGIGFLAGNVVYGAMAMVNETVAQRNYWEIVICTTVAGWVLGLSTSSRS